MIVHCKCSNKDVIYVVVDREFGRGVDLVKGKQFCINVFHTIDNQSFSKSDKLSIFESLKWGLRQILMSIPGKS